VVLSHQRAGAGCGLAGPDQGGGAEQADLGGQRSRVRDIPPVADRLAYQLLHRGDRVGSLRGPAPLALRCGISDGLQLAQGVSTAKLVIRGRIQ